MSENKYYHMTIAGCERDLPICPIDEHLDIAGFVMLGDVEITEKTAKGAFGEMPGARCGGDRRDQGNPAVL